jgi:hypothetical protein
MGLLEGRAEAISGEFNSQNVANTLWAYATMGRQPGERLMGMLEGRAEAISGEFKPQAVANTLWAYATMARKPGERLMGLLEQRAESMSWELNSQEVANTLWAYATMGWKPGERLMGVLEGRAEAISGDFNSQGVANTLWAYATIGRRPGERLMGLLEERAEAISGELNSQEVANTLWAYTTLGRQPGEGLLGKLEEQVKRHAHEFSSQAVANTLWTVCFFSIHNSDVACRFYRTVSSKLSVLDVSCFEEQHLSKMHQFFISCDLEEGVRARMPDSFEVLMDRLRATCKTAFTRCVAQPTPASAGQQQVCDALRGMGLQVTDEFRCAKSGYSIDMRVYTSDVRQEGLGRGAEEAHLSALKYRDLQVLAKEYDIKAHIKSSEIVTQLLKKGYTHVTSTPHLRLPGNSMCGAGSAVEFEGPSHFLACRSAKGLTLMKRRHLELLGYRLVSVPFWVSCRPRRRGMATLLLLMSRLLRGCSCSKLLLFSSG